MRPGLYTIPADLPFLDTLAAGLRQLAGGEPLALARMTVLLPTRRACRALREAFLRAGGGAPLLLPAMRPVGDAEGDEMSPGAAGIDLPPAISGLRRQLLLARLVERWAAGGAAPLLPGQAVALAGELARFLDEAEAERGGLDAAKLRKLAPREFAAHWELVLGFLGIVTEAWPAVLAEEACLDPAMRRNALLAAQIEAWHLAPPQAPVVAAGLVGGLPAVDDLLAAVLRLRAGYLVLPGLDAEMDEDERKAVIDDASHPQHRMLRFLAQAGFEPTAAASFVSSSAAPARLRLIAEVLRPAETTGSWQAAPGIDKAAIDGITWIDCPGPQEEAGTIALLMREALVQEGRTAALVTPDRALARRVAAELRRWDVEIDDSAGMPLAATPPGAFLRLLAAAVADALAPAPLLALLKHPLAGCGMAPERFRAAVRTLEDAALRGPRPAPGFPGLRAALAGHPASLALVDRIEAAIGAFATALAGEPAAIAVHVATHVAATEALAASDDETGPARLWAGEAGEAAARFVADLIAAAEGQPALRGSDYPAVLDALLAAPVVRPAWGKHPRLFIWGLVEARLQRADLMILGGLNEGTWPADPGSDPWLSRPMRAELGLASPEERIGAAAHDFAQGLAAPVVALTRATRVEGAETVPSRWLLRLGAVLDAAGLTGVRAGASVLRWQRLLDEPREPVRIGPPEPRPPVAARPRQLSATRIETWMRDPYTIYARFILRLKKLEPLDAEPGAAERGQIIHEALDKFLREQPSRLGPDAEERLLALGRECFGPALSRPGVWAFWWPRFERIARWFVTAQLAREPALLASATERDGRIEIATRAGPFVLTARADRIDRLAAGGFALLDYKTGRVPKTDDVALGFAPQLPLEAAIALAGGFGTEAAEVAELAYWRMTGNDPPGEIKAVAEDGVAVRRLADAALAGLQALVERFDDPATAYLAAPRPEWALFFNDYAHLARLKEWSLASEPDL